MTRAWKIVGIVAAVIVLSIVALVVWANVAGGRKFARMKELSLARLAEVRNADPRRPVLRGTAEPGNAFDDYDLAKAEVKKFPKMDRLFDRRTSKVDPEIAREALAGHGVAIDHLRRGAGRASARYPYEWEKGNRMEVPGLSQAVNLSSLAILQARALFDEGKPREGTDVLLDLCQFGRDFGADGIMISHMIGTSFLGSGFNELREHLVAGKFDRAALEDLDRGLETLDGSFPSWGQTLLNEALLFGGMLDDSAVAGTGPQRLLVADAFERIHESAAAAAKADALPWAEARPVLQRLEAEKSWNPISSVAAPAMVQHSSITRNYRAQLRTLRIAVHAAATGKVLDLDDPFGAKMRTEEKDGKFRIWSIGKDGVDDGGTGTWASESKDVVLELKK